MKTNLYIKNIFTNFLVIVTGYLGMLILMYINEITKIFVFESYINLGIIIIFIGVTIRIYASISFTKNNVEILEMNSHPVLVNSGLYLYSRNPLYIGILLVTLGFVLLSGSGFGFIFFIIFFLLINHVVIKKEEPELEEKFGEVYRNYKMKVKRWV